MNHVRKMTLVPFDQEDKSEQSIHEEKAQFGEGSKERTNPRQKMNDLLNIMLKLALIRAFDDKGRIRNKNGEYIENTDISLLLTNAMTPGRIIIAEEAFIELLKEANIPATLFRNENIKIKLTNSGTIPVIPLEPI